MNFKCQDFDIWSVGSAVVETQFTQNVIPPQTSLIIDEETYIYADPTSLLETISVVFLGSYSIYEVGKDQLPRQVKDDER